MSATSFFIILACAVLASLIASFICHLISPDLGEIAANISLVVLLSLTAVGLIGFTADPSQENTVEIQQSAIYTIQVIKNDGTVSFEYHGDAAAEIQPDRITLYDSGRTWTVFKDQNSTITITDSE